MVERGPGRPKGYFLESGQRVPGVTTVIGRFKDSGALMHWAWQQGMSGKDYRNTSGMAATAGVFGHAMIEADVHGRVAELPQATELGITQEEHNELVSKATISFGAFTEWKRNTNCEILYTELPLVSSPIRFGGTIDAVARINGELAILDWKTSNRIYADHLVQVAAYKILWNDNNQERIKAAHVLRIDKTYGTFEHHYWPEALLATGEEAFCLLRQLYDLEAVLKKAVGR